MYCETGEVIQTLIDAGRSHLINVINALEVEGHEFLIILPV